jgi:hypothetical protein
MNHRTLLAVLVLLAIAAPGIGVAASDDSRLETAPASKALPALAQQLLDALPSDSSMWKRYLSERASFVDEAGDVSTKAELVVDFRPFPAGITGSIRVEDARVTDFGDFATVVFVAREKQTVFGQSIEVGYRTSQTWRREKGRWRLVLWHNLVLTKDPPPIPVAPARLADYAGTYDLSGQRRYRIVARGDSLFGGAEGREPTPLIALGDNVFVEAGSKLAILHLFVRGEDGAVTRMVQRRKYADIVWSRVAESAPSPTK